MTKYNQKTRNNWIDHIQTYERYPLYNVTNDFQIDKNSRLTFEYLYNRIPDIWTRPKDKYYILTKMRHFNVVSGNEFYSGDPLEIELVEGGDKETGNNKDKDILHEESPCPFIIGEGFYSEEFHLFPSQIILQKLLNESIENPLDSFGETFSLKESIDTVTDFMMTTGDYSYLEIPDMSPVEYRDKIHRVEKALGVLLCLKSPVLNKILFSETKNLEYYIGFEESPLLAYFKYVKLTDSEEERIVDDLIRFYYRPRTVPIIKVCLQESKESKESKDPIREDVIMDPIIWRQMLTQTLTEVTRHKELVMKEVQSMSPADCIIEFS